MKKLMRIRLINWHRFADNTVNISDSVLLSGNSGSGKSTLLDAIQLVITCSKNNFNKAAQDKGKRTLNGYIRCKIGSEEQPFERVGPITSHVALEFYDEEKSRFFIVGVVMDSESEEKEPKAAWYVMENTKLDDELFLNGKQVKSTSVFRSTNKSIQQWATSQAEAKKIMLTRLGRLEDKFFSLIPKALAFQPINDIKDFVYSYVLDKKEINIAMLKENVQSYQKLEKVLSDVRKRIQELEEINKKEQEVQGFIRNDMRYEYFMARAEVEITYAEIESAQNQIKHDILRHKELEQERTSLAQEKEDRQNVIEALNLEIHGDKDYQALEEQRQKERRLCADLQEHRENLKEIKNDAKKHMSRQAHYKRKKIQRPLSESMRKS